MEKVEIKLTVDKAAVGYYQALAFQLNSTEEEVMAKALYAMALSLRYMEPPENRNTRTR